MARVRYTCTTPPHNKWWEIEYDEDMHGYTTWWGRIGEPPRGSRNKRFPSEWRCENACKAKVAEKYNKGYIREKHKSPSRKATKKKEALVKSFDIFGKM